MKRRAPRRTLELVMERTGDCEKYCIGCMDWKPEDQFNNHPGRPDGLAPRCKRCAQVETRIRTFNLRDEMFQLLLAKQGWRCAVCRTDDPGRGKDWNVDHDHSCCPGVRSCGKCIRGLLCTRCNTGLGLLGDSVERLQSAVEYLKKGWVK